jgi:hypothetical protein
MLSGKLFTLTKNEIIIDAQTKTTKLGKLIKLMLQHNVNYEKVQFMLEKELNNFC